MKSDNNKVNLLFVDYLDIECYIANLYMKIRLFMDKCTYVSKINNNNSIIILY